MRFAIMALGIAWGFALAPVALGSPSSATNVVAAFDQANRLYEEGRFEDAAQAYENLIHQGHVTATLYYNLGNARYKAGQLGYAIVAYRRGLELAPRDPDLRFNLRFVRKEVTGSAEGPESLWQRWLGRLSLDEWTWLALAAYWPWLGLLAAGEWRPAWKKSMRLYIWTAGVLTIVFTLGLLLAWRQHARRDEAVVVVPNAVIRYGPLEESQVAFQLRDGSEIRVTGRKEVRLSEGSQLWLHVTGPRGRSGWVKRDQVEFVHPSSPGDKRRTGTALRNMRAVASGGQQARPYFASVSAMR